MRVRRIVLLTVTLVLFSLPVVTFKHHMCGGAEGDEDLRRSAEMMDKVARTTFAPVYPALAKQIVDDTGVSEGVCVELGCGSGALGLALLKVTKLVVYAVDINPYAVAIAQRNAVEAGLSTRFYPMLGDALNLPFKDGFADLVVSRGMIPFIKEKSIVFKEAYRVLKSGGVAYIGGGFSRMFDEETVLKIVRQSVWGEPGKLPMRRIGKKEFEEQLKAAGILDYKIVEDRYPSGESYGLWVMFRKR